MELPELIIGLIISLILIAGFFSLYPEANQGKALSSSGLIASGELQIFSDQLLTQEISHVNWGTLEPGESASVSLVVLSKNKSPLSLGLNSTNWDPPAAQEFLKLSWDYSGAALNFGECSEIKFTLSVSEEIQDVESFFFEITIYEII